MTERTVSDIDAEIAAQRASIAQMQVERDLASLEGSPVATPEPRCPEWTRLCLV